MRNVDLAIFAQRWRKLRSERGTHHAYWRFGAPRKLIDGGPDVGAMKFAAAAAVVGVPLVQLGFGRGLVLGRRLHELGLTPLGRPGDARGVIEIDPIGHHRGE